MESFFKHHPTNPNYQDGSGRTALHHAALAGNTEGLNQLLLSAPTGEVGAANAKGYLEIWREMDDAGIDFGKGSYLPLRYKFSSDNTNGGILGPGFYMPMLEAKSILIREQVMRAYLPCGKGLYFWQDTADSTKFMTPDKEWTGAVNGDDFTVWRDDGWTIVYHLGQLTTIKTDEGHVFTWDYDRGTHMATGISKDGQPLVTVERNEQGLLGAVVVNGKRYEMDYAERPLPEILLGQPAIKQLALALSNFKYPDGKKESFKFAMTPQLVPTLTFTDPDQKQTLYTWDVATSHVATEQGPDGDWTYKIGETTQPFESPSITRTNPQGGSEGMAVDSQMGTYTQRGVDGVTTVTHVFETPGPLYHKVQKIEKINGNVTTLNYRASYDEAGRLIREVDENGFVTNFSYDAQGKLLKQIKKISSDPAKRSELAQKEENLLKLVSQASDLETKEGALQELAGFYLFNCLDKDKALAIISQIDHKHAFALRLQTIDYDPSLTPLEKISGYQTLLKEYPEYQENLNFIINARKEESKNEQQNG